MIDGDGSSNHWQVQSSSSCVRHGCSLLTIVLSDVSSLTDDTRVPCTTAHLPLGPGSSLSEDARVVIGIDDLPPELLVHIFRFLEPTCAQDIRLTHICRRWRAAVHAAPEFWRDLLACKHILRSAFYMRHHMFWHDILERTQQLPLRLSVTNKNIDILETPVFAPGLPRLAVLSVSWEHNPDLQSTFRRCMSALGPLPSLEVLQCVFDHSTIIAHPPFAQDPEVVSVAEIWVDRYPELRHYEVNPPFLDYRMMVPSLTTLVIHKGLLSLSRLLTAMQQCPNLEDLALTGLGNTRDGTVIVQPTTVHLAHLEEWKLIDNLQYSAFQPFMLRHVRCPPTTCILVMLCPNWHLSRLFPRDDAGLHHVGALPAVLQATTTFTLTFTPGDDLLEHPALWLQWFAAGEDRRPRLTVRLQSPRWDGTRRNLVNPTSLQPYPRLVDVASVLSPPSTNSITELHVDLAYLRTEASCMRRVEWTILLDVCPALVALTMRLRSCVGLLRALRQAPLRVPRLERLDVTCANMKGVHHGLVVTLDLRAAQGLRLRRLRFVHSNVDAPPLSHWHMERLRAVVSEEVVTS